MAGMYPDIEAQRMVTPLVDCSAQSYGTPARNDSNQNVPKAGGPSPALARPSASPPVLPVYAAKPCQTPCGMSTIGFIELVMVFMIASKFLLTVGKEEMPENVCWAIGGALYLLMMFLICLEEDESKKMKIVLPCFGAQVIRLTGILILVSCILYGYFKKSDILFAYKYNTDDSVLTTFAGIFWFFDVLAAIWVLAVLIKCHLYLRRLNKNYQSEGAYNVM